MGPRLGLRPLAATGFALLLLAAGDAGLKAASARPSPPAGSGAALVEPADDPFYRPPAGFEASTPGTVLAARPVTVTGLGLAVPVDARQFLVRSSDAHGGPTAVVGTLMVPTTPPATGPAPSSPTSRPPTAWVTSATRPTSSGPAPSTSCR